MDTTQTVIARVATLEGFEEQTTATGGIHLRDLEPMDVLLVRTRNSVYRIILLHGTEVTVQGGEFFVDPTTAFLDGSGFGGGLIKIGWVGLGLRMELRSEGRRILTSPVRSIVRETPRHRPH